MKEISLLEEFMGNENNFIPLFSLDDEQRIRE